MANLRATRIRGLLVVAMPLATAPSMLGCGGGSQQMASKDPAFQEIQRHEAGVQRAFAEADRADVACARRCMLSARACTHAEALCARARDIDDADALARCRRSRRTAEGLQERVRAECDCEARRRTEHAP